MKAGRCYSEQIKKQRTLSFFYSDKDGATVIPICIALFFIDQDYAGFSLE